MTSDQRKRFTVITNHELEHKEKEYHEAEKHRSYQTNPLREKLMKFVNNEAGKKFGVDDLLKW